MTSSSRNKIMLSHTQANFLIPEFLNGVLSADKYQAMQEHLAQCNVCFDECQTARVLKDQLQHTDTDLEEILTSKRMNQNFSGLMARIDSEQPQSVDTDTSSMNIVVDRSAESKKQRESLFSQIGRMLQHTPNPMRYAIFVQACALLVCVILLVNDDPSQQVLEYQTLTDVKNNGSHSAGAIHGHHVFRVIFHPKASESDVRDLLLEQQGQITGGPSMSGVYTIAVSGDQQQQTVLQSLRSSPWVEFAEPVVDLSRQ